jgi:hypothetical protein
LALYSHAPFHARAEKRRSLLDDRQDDSARAHRFDFTFRGWLANNLVKHIDQLIHICVEMCVPEIHRLVDRQWAQIDSGEG